MLNSNRQQSDSVGKSEYLIVDLDHTLIQSDIFLESSIKYLFKNPFRIAKLIWYLLLGRSKVKALLAKYVSIDPSALPYNKDLLEHIRDEYCSSSRKIYLATATHQVFAEQIAAHLGIFHGVIATTNEINRKGKKKLAGIQAVVGNSTWTYAGDSKADIPIWRMANLAILVNAPHGIERELLSLHKVEKSIRRSHSMLNAFVRSIRVHQWTKNALVIVPLLTSHLYQDVSSVVSTLIAFLCFCLCASGVYLLNDLVDIDSDRKHATKRLRPIASGELPINVAVLGAILLPFVAIVIAVMSTNTLFLATIVAYLAINVGYSLYIKRIRTVDVLTLAVLYTLRIVAGAAAISVTLSSWLLAFSVFLFVSLAYLKRYIEVAAIGADGRKLSGRGYSSADRETMFVLGASNATAATLVMALFITSEDVVLNYKSPEVLWALCFIMLYWTNRIWVKARSGDIEGDPVAFAIRDKISLFLGVSCVVVVVLARVFSFGYVNP